MIADWLIGIVAPGRATQLETEGSELSLLSDSIQ
jgi:hypothetical protein